MHTRRYEHFLEKPSQQGALANVDELPEWRGIGNGDHAVNLLTRTARRRFECCRLAIQIRFRDLG